MKQFIRCNAEYICASPSAVRKGMKQLPWRFYRIQNTRIFQEILSLNNHKSSYLAQYICASAGVVRGNEAIALFGWATLGSLPQLPICNESNFINFSLTIHHHHHHQLHTMCLLPINLMV